MITPGKYLNKKLTRFHIKGIGFFLDTLVQFDAIQYNSPVINPISVNLIFSFDCRWGDWKIPVVLNLIALNHEGIKKV